MIELLSAAWSLPVDWIKNSWSSFQLSCSVFWSVYLLRFPLLAFDEFGASSQILEVFMHRLDTWDEARDFKIWAMGSFRTHGLNGWRSVGKCASSSNLLSSFPDAPPYLGLQPLSEYRNQEISNSKIKTPLCMLRQDHTPKNNAPPN